MKANIAGKVSFHCGKQYSIAHNTREYDADKWNKDGHIDPERSSQNITLYSIPLKQFFSEKFSDALKKYNTANEKKHPDRVMNVEQYYTQQKGKAQEAIFQLSDHENYLKLVEQVGQNEADKMHIAYLTDVYSQWKKDNPSLEIFFASIHMYEVKDGAPHLHLDFVPVAESSRGLSVKISMDGAMKTLGFTRELKQKYDETPFKQWLNQQRLTVERLAESYINVVPSEPCVRGHRQPQEWKAEEAKRSKIQCLKEAFQKNKTLKDAQAIIDNAESIVQVAQSKANEIADKARIEQLKAKRAIKTAEAKTEQAEEDTAIARAKTKQAEQLQAVAFKNNRIVNSKRAKLELTVQKEVLRQTTPNTQWERIRQENERFKRQSAKRLMEYQEELESVAGKTTNQFRKVTEK